MFPANPTNGQQFVDSQGITWIFRGISWESLGIIDALGTASEDVAGLVPPHLHAVISEYSQHHGGFGIIINPLSYADLIVGDITLKSNTLDFSCSQDNLNVSIRRDWIDGITWEVCGRDGPVGYQGATGKKGLTGLGDGPQGYQGVDGLDNQDPIGLTGFGFLNGAELTDTAIVDMSLSGHTILTRRSAIAVPGVDIPPNQLVAVPLFRLVSFTDKITDYVISGGDDQLGTNFMVCGSGAELSPIPITTYLNAVANKYASQLANVDSNHALQAKATIEAADAKARLIISELYKELTDCEMRLQKEALIDMDVCPPPPPPPEPEPPPPPVEPPEPPPPPPEESTEPPPEESTEPPPPPPTPEPPNCSNGECGGSNSMSISLSGFNLCAVNGGYNLTCYKVVSGVRFYRQVLVPPAGGRYSAIEARLTVQPGGTYVSVYWITANGQGMSVLLSGVKVSPLQSCNFTVTYRAGSAGKVDCWTSPYFPPGGGAVTYPDPPNITVSI